MNSRSSMDRPSRAEKPPEAELKYTISASRVDSAIALLSSRFRPDPDFPTGIVSSIYYDSRNWLLLGEKRNSDYLKTKVRLRWYMPVEGAARAGSDAAFAEVKHRIGSTRKKVRIQTAFTVQQLQYMQLNSRDLMTVLRDLQKVGIVFQKSVFPVFVVRYIRRRYIDPTTQKRICIDYNITAPKVNRAVLPASLPFALESAVIEVKSHDHEFPIALRPLQPLGLRRTAFSKYYECYAALTNTFF